MFPVQMNQQQQAVTLNINQNVNIQQDGYAFNSGAPADQPLVVIKWERPYQIKYNLVFVNMILLILYYGY